jgi:hypothetical protein
MTQDSQRSKAIQAEIARLCNPGLLGFYTHVEIVEIIAFVSQAKRPINVFTIMVAEDREGSEVEQPYFLNAKPIVLPTLKHWKFGILRYTRRIDSLTGIIHTLSEEGTWEASGDPLQLGSLTFVPGQFVPPDSTKAVPWNKVLKNNFWNGSYVFEWADAKKSALQLLFDKPQRLQDLSDAVGRYVPVRIGSLSDRLGNVVLQCPATVCMAKFARLNPEGEWVVQIGWHPKASPRPLRATCAIEFDDSMLGYASCVVDGLQTRLPLAAEHGLHQGFVWDDENRLTLAATGPSAFITTIGLRMAVADPEPRVFTIGNPDGSRTQQRVGLVSVQESRIGKGETENDMWTRRRMYRDETARLAAERRFVQYRPQPGCQQEEHEAALTDIRSLINQHGQDGAWLWDPYLSAHDILQTLFYCSEAGVDLRGLTAALVRSEQKSPKSRLAFVATQQQEFATANSNLRGLRLEYRVKIGPAGWGFHDRFLIFPRSDRGALAWSLGTSVNSLGKQHHILQRVDDGQRIKDAFLELWDALDQPEHLIWKTP